ncbi:hypothetical protein SD78_0940 [Bacillus badius]|nr:hypothetical protein SD78_0940 [Bacillus badius]
MGKTKRWAWKSTLPICTENKKECMQTFIFIQFVCSLKGQAG